MVPLTSLWLAVLLAAVIVFVASSVLHMAFRYHQADFQGLPREAEVAEALRPFAIPPGHYYLPHASSLKESSSPEYLERAEAGPVAIFNVLPSGPPAMGGALAQWFVYCLVIGVFVAYVTGRTLGPSAEYMTVFRLSGTTAFLAYAGALWQQSIWYKVPWANTARSTFDGLVYALLTAGVFGWLWPG